MNSPNNPFCFLHPLTPDSQFLYYNDPLAIQILDDLMLNRYCLVIGQPGGGTTSMLLATRKLYLERRTGAAWISVDLEKLNTKTDWGIYQFLVQQCSEIFPELSGRWKQHEKHLTQFRDEQKLGIKSTLFIESLLGCLANNPQPVVICFDHIEVQPAKLIDEVVIFVRKLSNLRNMPFSLSKRITIIIGGSGHLHQLGVEKGSPLNFANRHHLTDIPIETVTTLIKNIEESYPWRFSSDAIDHLANSVNGDRYLLHRLAFELIEDIQKSGQIIIDKICVEETITQFSHYWYQDDPRLMDLIPNLTKNEDGLNWSIRLLNGEIISVDQTRLQIDPYLSRLFKQVNGTISFKNPIYAKIVKRNQVILNTIYSLNLQQKNLQKLQRLNFHVELSGEDSSNLYDILIHIRNFFEVESVYLLIYNEITDCFETKITTNNLVRPKFCLLQTAITDILETKIQPLIGFWTPNNMGDYFSEESATNTTCLALIEPESERLAGLMLLVGRSLDLANEFRQELIQIGHNLAESLYRKRIIDGIEKFSQIILEPGTSSVFQEICEITSELFNKPCVMLWEGNSSEDLPVKAAFGCECEQIFLPRFPSSHKHQTIFGIDKFSPDEPFISKIKQNKKHKDLLFTGFPIEKSQSFAVIGIGSNGEWKISDLDKSILEIICKLATVLLYNLYSLNLSQSLTTSAVHKIKNHSNQIISRLASYVEVDGHNPLIVPYETMVDFWINAKQLEKGVINYLQFIRINAGNIKKEFKCTPLYPILDETLKDLVIYCEAKGIKLLVKLDKDLPSHNVWNFYVELILENLVYNSLDAEATTITVQAQKVNSSTYVIVQDDGKGVPPELKDGLFDISKWSDDRKEKGLGLWLVKKFMETMGGSVHLDTNFSSGARFVLIFPT